MGSDEQITEYLECVAVSEVLGKSERRLHLLEYLIRTEHSGAGDTLKAYAIGIDVLGKPDDFDPAIDSSVRVEMGRLRTALASFESSDAARCTLSVEIPTGSYRPKITQRAAKVTDSAARPTRKTLFTVAALSAILTAMVLVAAFLLLPRADEPTPRTTAGIRLAMDSFEGTATETAQVEAALRESLVRNPSIAILSQRTGDTADVDFALRGLISHLNRFERRVSVELLNVHEDRVIWTKSVGVSDEDDIAQRVSDEVGGELNLRLLGASKDFLEGRNPKSLTAQQLFLMATWVPSPKAANSLEWEEQKIALMQLALDRNPDLGTAHSVMADKLAQLANFYPDYNTPETQEMVLTHIDRATRLEPFHPDAMFNVAQAHWHAGRIRESHVVMRRVLDLDPGHGLARFLADVVPYTCVVPPPSVIARTVAFDAALSPNNPMRWITLNWIAWLKINAGDDEGALQAKEQASLIFETPYTFAGHAMLLNRMGRPDDAMHVMARQQSNWPAISAAHFAQVTMPRLCRESDAPGPLLGDYEALANLLARAE
ncbi:tetratricopeptide repeat protein [Roseobacter sp. CCS2]|uniref:tetratricopeptide repeat protein n=1 Tax=Roseobacter sp. CCS2 TaxID=391593 RepID=UPI0000F3E3BF|nr:hypothetical protein [Roseobacter sp. CCS2]EBA11987.1 hypothetical protein RCCS2_11859 [Roseobacter sp. CCS2]